VKQIAMAMALFPTAKRLATLDTGAGMTPRTRTGLVIAFAVALGLFTYGSLAELSFFDSDAAGVTTYALALFAGVLVKRWWALLAVLGPAVVLAALEATGYVTHAYLEWGDRPLFSPPGIFDLIALGVAILLGIALGTFGEALAGRWAERRGAARHQSG
jgi:hypothetical protein